MDLSCPLLGLFDLLPRLHVLLLEQGDAVCEQLRVLFNAADRSGSRGLLFASFLNVCQRLGAGVDAALVLLEVCAGVIGPGDVLRC